MKPLRLHRHERQDAEGRRSFDDIIVQHARIGEGVRHRQGGARLPPAHRAHGQRRRIVELSPRPRSGSDAPATPADSKVQSMTLDRRKPPSRSGSACVAIQAGGIPGRWPRPRSQLPETLSHSDRIAGDFRLLTPESRMKERRRKSPAAAVFSTSGTVNGGNGCLWHFAAAFSRSINRTLRHEAGEGRTRVIAPSSETP